MPFICHGHHRFLFVHIPKTGGTSVEKWLGSFDPLQFHCAGIPPFSKCTPQHYTYNDLKNLFSGSFFDYAFTIVRDPYTRIESEYRMRWILAQEGHWGAFPRFSQWLETQLDATRQHKWQLDNHLRPQVDFIGKSIKVFRFEEGLDTILKQVSADTGLAYGEEAGRELSTGAFAGELEWDLQDRLKVNRFYAQDFEYFGYSIVD